MLRKIILSVVFVFLTAVLIEAIGLGVLQHNRGAYAKYWQERTHEQTDGNDFVYVAIGDSVAQGLGASQPANGYVGQVAQLLAERTGRRVHVVNLSVTGAKLQDIIDKQLPQLKQYHPDLLTLDVGANDMSTFDAVRFRSQFEQVAAVLPTDSIVANVPYAGKRTTFNANARSANAIIELIARRNNVPVVDIYHDLAVRQSPLIYAADFYHPNDRGYAIWTQSIWQGITTNFSLL